MLLLLEVSMEKNNLLKNWTLKLNFWNNEISEDNRKHKYKYKYL